MIILSPANTVKLKSYDNLIEATSVDLERYKDQSLQRLRIEKAILQLKLERETFLRKLLEKNQEI